MTSAPVETLESIVCMHACNARVWRPDLKGKVMIIPIFPILNRVRQADFGMVQALDASHPISIWILLSSTLL